MKKILFLIFLPSILWGQTRIDRSIGPGNTSQIASGGTIRVSNDTLYCSEAMPDSFGAGCVMQYDADNDADIDASDGLGFVQKRIDEKTFIIKNAAGGSPIATAAPTTVRGGFYAYTSAFNWEAGIENSGIDADLSNFDTGNRDISSSTGANEQWHVAGYVGIDATAISINGWKTGSAGDANYIRLYTPKDITEVGRSQRNATSVYNNALGYSIEVAGVAINFAGNANEIRIEGLQISATGTTAGGISGAGVGTNDIRISHCRIKGPGGSLTGTHIGINCGVGAGTVRIWNNVLFDWTSSAAGNTCAILGSGSGTSYIYNNTMADNQDGIQRVFSTVIPKNNLATGSSGSDFSGTFSNAENNASGDATAPGTSSRTNQTFTFANAASDNFALAAGDTAAGDRGKDLSADANLVIDDDLLGTDRPQDHPAVEGTFYDIGALEFFLTVPIKRRRIVQ